MVAQPETAAVASVLVGLLPVIVGGPIGVLGGLVGLPLAHFLGRAAAEQDRRRERFEELCSKIFEYEEWMERWRNVRVYGRELQVSELSPLSRARTIASLYFPQFDPLLVLLEGEANAYDLWMNEASQRRLRGEVEDLNQEFEAVHGRYYQQLLFLKQALTAFAKAGKVP